MMIDESESGSAYMCRLPNCPIRNGAGKEIHVKTIHGEKPIREETHVCAVCITRGVILRKCGNEKISSQVYVTIGCGS